jgi:hypothetical protein
VVVYTTPEAVDLAEILRNGEERIPLGEIRNRIENGGREFQEKDMVDVLEEAVKYKLIRETGDKSRL